MARKGFIFLLIVLVAGLAILIWFVQSNSQTITTDPMSVIPRDACFVVESADLPDLINSVTDGNRLFKALESTKGAEVFCEKVRYLGNLSGGKELREIMEKTRTIISFHYSDNGKVSTLLTMNLLQKSRYRRLLEAIKSNGGTEIGERRKGGIRYIPVLFKTGTGSDTIFFVSKSGLIICSPSEDLLIKACRQGKPGSDIREMPGFTRIMGAAGRKENKVYIIFRNFARLINSVTGSRSPALAGRFANLAGSAEADIHLSENGLILSGFTESTDSTEYLYKYKSRQAGKLSSYEILPSDVQLFETMLLKDNAINIPGSRNTAAGTADLAAGLSPFIGDEITRAILDIGDTRVPTGNVVIFKLANRQMAEQILTEKTAAWARNINLKEKDYIQYFQPDDQTKIPVYSTPFTNLSEAFLPGFVPPEGDSLFAFTDNYLISANSFGIISKVLYNNILNKTLANDLAYRDFEATLPSRAGYYFYCVPAEILNFLSPFVNDSVINVLNRNIPLLRKFQAAGYQFSPSNGMIYNTLSLRLGDTSRIASGAEWETLLDTSASMKPFFFTNHNTGAREIFIQDNKNHVYLINSAGRVLWKVAPGEKILGDVYMIDYFVNGKYQILFAGRNNLYLLDRNGNYVERFPAKLRSPASGPPSLFDYDGTGEYRILIPGEDRLIYAYDKSGNVVKGWKPYRTGGVVKSGIRFFKVSGKDYLIAADDKSVYILDRTGNQRIKIKESVTKAENSELRLDNNRYPGIVFTSPEGIITKVSFDGTVTRTQVRNFSTGHSFDFFDVDGDGIGEYVFVDKGILYLYDNDKSEIFTRDFGTPNLEGPVFFIFSAMNRKIGVTDPGKKLIYMIDKDGDNMNGFPLKGASVFSIGKLSEKGNYHLIVGGDDNFLYNYSIETGN